MGLKYLVPLVKKLAGYHFTLPPLIVMSLKVLYLYLSRATLMVSTFLIGHGLMLLKGMV